jgi:phosphoserine aminotransferase
VRQEAIVDLLGAAPTYLGTSHRQPTVQFTVAALRNGLHELFALPDGYEIMLGNGGSTLFWDAACFSLIERKSQHLSFGSSPRSSPPRSRPRRSSRLRRSSNRRPGHRPDVVVSDEVDSTRSPQRDLDRRDDGARAPGRRRRRQSHSSPSTRRRAPVGCAFIRTMSTSITSHLRNASAATAACGSPQCPPRPSTHRAHCALGPLDPAILDLDQALQNSRKDQTLNTPALATLFLTVHQIDWINSNGGLAWSSARCDQSAEHVYSWAETSDYATPFVAASAQRSHVVATIDLDPSISADTVAKVLRANGVLDTESYRKLGRNQLRWRCSPPSTPKTYSR